MKIEKIKVCPNCEVDYFLFETPFSENEFVNCSGCGCEFEENELKSITIKKGKL
jgi:hypothetical protein